MAEEADPMEQGLPLPVELGEITSQLERRWLSMLLFMAREQMAMWGDVVEKRTGVRDRLVDDIRDAIDDYRAVRGWSPHGFGREE